MNSAYSPKGCTGVHWPWIDICREPLDNWISWQLQTLDLRVCCKCYKKNVHWYIYFHMFSMLHCGRDFLSYFLASGTTATLDRFMISKNIQPGTNKNIHMLAQVKTFNLSLIQIFNLAQVKTFNIISALISARIACQPRTALLPSASLSLTQWRLISNNLKTCCQQGVVTGVWQTL